MYHLIFLVSSSFHLLLFSIVLNDQHCLLTVINYVKWFVLFDFLQASNPGQFDNDIDNVWQKGHTSESVFHTVRLLVSHGGIKAPHCHLLNNIIYLFRVAKSKRLIFPVGPSYITSSYTHLTWSTAFPVTSQEIDCFTSNQDLIDRNKFSIQASMAQHDKLAI